MNSGRLVTDDLVVDKIALLYSGGITAFDYGMKPSDDKGICWAIARVGDVMVLVFRGSQTVEDWVRDFIAVPVSAMLPHPKHGIVPAGFALGMMTAYDDILPLLQFPFIVAGHSLGAARACWFAARYDGAAPLLGAVLCGCPRPGDAAFRHALDSVLITSYRNGPDPVPALPPAPFVPVRPYCMLSEHPPGDAGIFHANYHHIELYQAGVRGLEAMKVAA